MATLAAPVHPQVKGLQVFYGVNKTRKKYLKEGRNQGNRNHQLRNASQVNLWE